jgi:CubicO group peptidase (beta-lactamase class C family)
MSLSTPMKGLCAAVMMAPLATTAVANGKDPLPRVDPASVGMSAERLARIVPAFKAEIEKDRIPGVVLAVARRGKLAYFEAIGAIDPATNAPMTTDALFSLASMTKPMVSVGIMILHEEGKLFLNDPVGLYLPQLKDMKVADVTTDANGKETIGTKTAKRQSTIQDLLRHTSGLTYGARGNTPVHKLWPRGSGVAATQFTGPEFLETIGKLPLLHEPGTVWDYSLSTDVLGLVIEAVSGKPLSAFLSERIWQPLGMVDTAFTVPDDKKVRHARAFPNDPLSGKPQSVMHAPGSKPIKFECGGACAVATAGDYIRFSQMLLNGGVLDGKRILGSKTVAYMTSNHIGPEIANNVALTDASRQGYGFGLGFAVRLTPGIAGVSGSEGDYNWGGAFGTFFWNDPKEQLTVVFMSQGPGPIRTYYRKFVNALVLQALVE